MSSILDKEQVDACFDGANHQADILIALYRLVYDGSAIDRPEWAIVKCVSGWPKLGAEASKYICERFIEFDQLHHPECIVGGLWINNGFSQDATLGAWECKPAPVELL